MWDFRGKVVLVTGSSRGLGRTLVEEFAQAGADCVINYFADPDGQNQRDAEHLAEQLRRSAGRMLVIEADVRQPQAVERMMQQVASDMGGLDILVNNAGICRDRTVKNMTLDDWHSVLDTNLHGVFYCCKYALNILRDGGRIINIASISAWACFHGQANYAAAKAGVIALTKVLAKELARRHITVNAIAPGLMRTAMLQGIRPEVLAEYEKQIPLGRLAETTDVAQAVLFLASPAASYITGQVLPVSGGWY
ncbi:MAG: SDR family NAD(P)-dependent oxidoreductase [Gemmatales bacterium]|nr:SDR family oxidoreductase [Gemmatales bacterium]MDW7994538.1 SDR family NAD(P)-dependent oxidoreductase [Gemmatales bacterium]